MKFLAIFFSWVLPFLAFLVSFKVFFEVSWGSSFVFTLMVFGGIILLFFCLEKLKKKSSRDNRWRQ